MPASQIWMAGWLALAGAVAIIFGHQLILTWQSNFASVLVLAWLGVSESSEASSSPLVCQASATENCIPDSVLPAQLSGRYWLARNRSAEAIAALERSDINNPVNALWLGEAYQESGRSADALAIWRRAGAAAYFLEVGHVPYEAGDYASACVYYQRGVDIAPDMAEAHMYLGHCHSRQGDLALAEAEYRRAMELNPDYGYPYIHLATLLMIKRHQPDQARAVLQMCITQSQSVTWRAECAKTLGDIK